VQIDGEVNAIEACASRARFKVMKSALVAAEFSGFNQGAL